MIKYHSTNNKTPNVDFKTAVLRGQALDKGLYMLNKIPKISTEKINSFKNLVLPEIGFEIFSEILGNIIPDKELKKILNDALNFHIPIDKIQRNDYICYLDQGSTASFKDFGARTLAKIMEYFLNSDDKESVILTATSGDTGGAVAQAFFDLKRIKVIVLYPRNEISELQRKQMTTLGRNVTAFGIDGKFDDCQRLVKTAFSDPELVDVGLSSANSINIGRLIPQTFYYFYCHSRIVDALDEKIIFSVPSGNLGNLMAGLIAYKMGLGVRRFISAVNENNEFPKFLETGIYEKIEPSKNCISSAMNVGHPSNLARIIDLYGGHIDEKGLIHKNPKLSQLRENIISFSITDDLTRKTIVNFYKKYKKIIEPHGAVGWAGLKIYRNKYPEDSKYKSICFETADPAKFPEEVYPLINIKPQMPKTLEIIQNKKEIENSTEISNYNDFKIFIKNKL
jgi:threonine synthase